MITITQPTTLRAGIIKRIHVNGAMIRANKAEDLNEPCFTVKCRDGNYYCRRFTAERLAGIQNFQQRLPSGAVVWLETTSAVTLYP